MMSGIVLKPTLQHLRVDQCAEVPEPIPRHLQAVFVEQINFVAGGDGAVHVVNYLFDRQPYDAEGTLAALPAQLPADRCRARVARCGLPRSCRTPPRRDGLT